MLLLKSDAKAHAFCCPTIEIVKNNMIPRYNRPKIENIWTLENKFKIWTEIEILIAEKLSDIGVIPKIAAKEIKSR